MQVLEKILEEIEKSAIKVSTVKGHTYFKAVGTRKIEEIIRSHMDDEDTNASWIDCKKAMPGKDMDKQPVWIVYGSHGNLSVEFAYCKWVLSEDEDGNDDSYTEFSIDQAPEPYHPSLNLVHYWKPVNIPKFEKE